MRRIDDCNEGEPGLAHIGRRFSGVAGARPALMLQAGAKRRIVPTHPGTLLPNGVGEEEDVDQQCDPDKPGNQANEPWGTGCAA